MYGPAYDVPRAGGSGAGSGAGSNRRNNPRYAPIGAAAPAPGSAFQPQGGGGAVGGAAAQRQQRKQRSFDDTESYQYINLNSDYARYENTYERVREEPEYQNAGRMIYGQLNVIGHGVGRIERHLSSSCGNIDHYSLGGHYAVLGHSHLGTVGHIHLNPAQQNAKDTSVRSFFSCLGGENSQSMTNIDRAGSASGSGSSSGAGTSGTYPNPSSDPPPPSIIRTSTGAVPKTKSTGGNSGTARLKALRNEHNVSTLNRISKSSLQWLLVNKWLPLWAAGESPEYKVVDFNFMFSRKCEGCDDGDVVRYGHHQQPGGVGGGAGEIRMDGDYIPPPREYPTMNGHYPRVIRPNNQQMPRLAETYEYRTNDLYDRPRRYNPMYRRCQGPPPPQQQQQAAPQENNYEQDPFRNWAFNFDNNTFRPAGAAGSSSSTGTRPKEIRRITDGTFPTVASNVTAPSYPQPPAAQIDEIEAVAGAAAAQEAQPRNSPPPSSVASVSTVSVDGNSSDADTLNGKGEQSSADESQ